MDRSGQWNQLPEDGVLGVVVGGVPGERQEQSWRVEWAWHTVAMGKWHKGRWEKLVRGPCQPCLICDWKLQAGFKRGSDRL